MNIKLEWFNCAALPEWEAGLHQMLLEATSGHLISQASIRIEETPGSRDRFHLVGMLRLQGPDVIACGDGETFDDALLHLAAQIRDGLQALPSRQNSYQTAQVLELS